MSTDQTLSGDDILLGTAVAVGSPLAAGAFYDQVNYAVTLPLDGNLSEGDYYLIVNSDAEDAQVESDENDNVAVSSPITLTFPDLPDLQVADVGVTEVNPISGQPMTITWPSTEACRPPQGCSTTGLSSSMTRRGRRSLTRSSPTARPSMVLCQQVDPLIEITSSCFPTDQLVPVIWTSP